jgi:uncharacterized protein (DUF1778 family)
MTKKRQEREKVVSLTLFEDEKDLIDKAAAAVGLATAAFVRSKAIDAARVVLHQKAENTP